MKKSILSMLFLLSVLMTNCERKKIYDVIETGDSYLPDIHWKTSDDNNYQEVDTVFVRADRSFKARVEIFYDDPKDFRPMEIHYETDTRHLGLYKTAPGMQMSTDYVTDTKLDSPSDKIVIDHSITPSNFKLILLEAMISEREKTDYDLKRFKTLFIANSDSSN